MEYQYWIALTQEMYEVKINPDTGDIVRIESDLWMDNGSATVTLTEEDVLQKISALFPGAQVSWVMLDKDDGLHVYRVQFTTAAYVGQVKLHPESGKVLEMELDYAAARQDDAAAPKTTAKPKTTTQDALIGTDRAKEIALRKAGGGTVTHIELDRDDGRQVYEGEIIYGNDEYEFEIDALTGQIRDWDKDRRDD